MFGISGTEIILVLIVAVLVIGPKDIPRVMYALGRLVRRAQYIRYAFSQQFDDFMKTHDLDELRRGVNFEAPEYDEKPVCEEISKSDTKVKPD